MPQEKKEVTYIKWTEEQVALMKRELWKQKNSIHINWNIILPLFPGRTKQQLISYRNGHKNEIYESPPPIIDQQLCELGRSSLLSNNIVNNELNSETSREHVAMYSMFQLENQALGDSLFPVDPFYFVRNNFLITTIEGLEGVNDQEFRKKIKVFTQEYNQDDLLETRHHMMNNNIASKLIAAGADPFAIYKSNDLIVNHLRSFMVEKIVKSIILCRPFVPKNPVQMEFFEAIQQYLTTNQLNIYQVQFYITKKHFIEDIVGILLKRVEGTVVGELAHQICQDLQNTMLDYIQ